MCDERYCVTAAAAAAAAAAGLRVSESPAYFIERSLKFYRCFFGKDVRFHGNMKED